MQGGGHPSVERGGRGGGLCSLRKKAAYHPVAFSSGMPHGFRLSRLLDLRSVRKAMVASDTDRWKDVVDREIQNLASYHVMS